jgi:hypothetical protein
MIFAATLILIPEVKAGKHGRQGAALTEEVSE